jgi:hypothetical protein
MPEIYFLSDFGLADPYAAVVKAVMRQIAAEAMIHDLAHNLPPGDLNRASYILYLRVLPHSSTPAILSKTLLRMRLWTKRIRFTRATRPQKDRASIR